MKDHVKSRTSLAMLSNKYACEDFLNVNVKKKDSSQ